jgi:hypothetical protein
MYCYYSVKAKTCARGRLSASWLGEAEVKLGLGCLGLGVREQFDGGSRMCHISANRFFERYITCSDSSSGSSSCSSSCSYKSTTQHLSRVPLMQALPGLVRQASSSFSPHLCSRKNWLLQLQSRIGTQANNRNNYKLFSVERTIRSQGLLAS